MIQQYVARALARAACDPLDDGAIAGTVRGLRGVLATAGSVQECRSQLAEVIEEWVLVRVARGLPVPALGGVRVTVTARR